MIFRRHAADAGVFQKFVERWTLQLRCNVNRWNIAAADQCLGRGNRTEKSPIEIFRREWTERCRHIAQYRLRMQHALIETKCVDEWLQRRTRRTFRERTVDLSGYLRIFVVGRSDERLDAHVARVDGDGHGVADAAICVVFNMRGDLALEQSLHSRIERRMNLRRQVRTAHASIGDHFLDEVRRGERQMLGRTQAQRQFHQRCHACILRMIGDPSLEQPFARVGKPRTDDVGGVAAVAHAAAWILRDHRERQRFGQ